MGDNYFDNRISIISKLPVPKRDFRNVETSDSVTNEVNIGSHSVFYFALR